MKISNTMDLDILARVMTASSADGVEYTKDEASAMCSLLCQGQDSDTESIPMDEWMWLCLMAERAASGSQVTAG